MRRRADAGRGVEDLPGFDLASAISSCTLLTPVEGCTTRITAAVLMSAIGVRSLVMSNGRLGLMAALVMLADDAMNSV